MNVLIVDDEALKADYIRRAVEENLLGSNVDIFSYVCDAIAACKEKKYDLFITDMHYKVRDGESINSDAGLIFIRNTRKMSDKPIIVCSSEHRDIPDKYENVRMITFSPNSISTKIENELKGLGLM